MQQRLYVPSFHFNTAKRCCCGLGKPFGTCCEAEHLEKAPPKNMTAVNNFISPSECKSFIRYADKQIRE